MGIWATAVQLTKKDGSSKLYSGACYGSFMSYWTYSDTRKDAISTKVHIFAPRAWAKRFALIWPKIMDEYFVPDRFKGAYEYGTFTAEEYQKLWCNTESISGDSAPSPNNFSYAKYVPCFTITVTDLTRFTMTDWLVLHTLAIYAQRHSELLNNAFRWWIASKKQRSLHWAWWISHGKFGDQGHAFWGSYPQRGWAMTPGFLDQEKKFDFKKKWDRAPWKQNDEEERPDMTVSGHRQSMNPYFGRYFQNATDKINQQPDIKELRAKMYEQELHGDYTQYCKAKDAYQNAFKKYFVSQEEVWEKGKQCAI